jgi:hypothetical protein
LYPKNEEFIPLRTPPMPDRRRLTASIRDDLAYVAPMALFLLITQAGVWWPALFPVTYVIKTVLVAGLLVLLWPRFTKIRWEYWWLGALMGIVGVVQWVGMENLLLSHWPNYPRLSGAAFDPFVQIHAPAMQWTYVAVRWAGAALLVPVMEELFWRDFLWRSILAPNDFKLACIGERDWKTWLLVAALFSCVHVQWMTAIVWGLMIGGLLMLTRSLSACIVMHAVTNFLLGLYVLRTRSWYFW